MAYYSTTSSTFNRAFTIPTTATIPWAPLAGRILLAAIFILSGLTKPSDWQGTSAYMAAHGIPLIPILLPLAVVVEIAGGLAIVFGAKSRTAAMLLFLYLIPTTLIFHNFWSFQGQEYVNQMHHFLKNLAIMGGLALIVGLGPGGMSVDSYTSTKRV
jgi:putative oxidoreductase